MRSRLSARGAREGYNSSKSPDVSPPGTRSPKGLQVNLRVFEAFDHLVSDRWLRRVAECTLALEPPRSRDDLSVVIADDDTVRDLNRRHRGLDETTDVLSFSFSHGGEYYGRETPSSERSEDADFVLPPGEGAGLGEVIISYPQAVRQAEDSDHTVERELALLLAHGVLHLLGYDHVKPDQEAAMKAKEAMVLARALEDE